MRLFINRIYNGSINLAIHGLRLRCPLGVLHGEQVSEIVVYMSDSKLQENSYKMKPASGH